MEWNKPYPMITIDQVLTKQNEVFNELAGTLLIAADSRERVIEALWELSVSELDGVAVFIRKLAMRSAPDDIVARTRLTPPTPLED